MIKIFLNLIYKNYDNEFNYIINSLEKKLIFLS